MQLWHNPLTKNPSLTVLLGYIKSISRRKGDVNPAVAVPPRSAVGSAGTLLRGCWQTCINSIMSSPSPGVRAGNNRIVVDWARLK